MSTDPKTKELERARLVWSRCDAGACGPSAPLDSCAESDGALLHYPNQHYAEWRKEAPECFETFVLGAFGENLSADDLDETIICIGDKVRLGSALLQVTRPFQPGFKLNDRLGIPSIARRANETSRTGWYYKILEFGDFSIADEIVVTERPHPDWSVSRVQHYLFKETINRQIMKELSDLEALAPSTRDLFKTRLKDLALEDELLEKIRAGLPGAPPREVGSSLVEPSLHENESWTCAVVRGIYIESSKVRSFYLSSPSGKRLPDSQPGAHLKLKLPNGLIKHYSLCKNCTGEEYHIAVGRSPAGGGGSIFLHDQVKVGDLLQISAPINTFAIDETAGHHVMIAGGVGITPFLSMIEYFERERKSYELHFCSRNERDTPFHRVLSQLPSSKVKFHHNASDPSRGINFSALISDIDDASHIYCCGPIRLMRAVESAAADISRKRLHFESFTPAQAGNQPFEIKIESTGKILPVRPDQTILSVLRNNGIDVPSSCEAGSCGTCMVRYSEGDVEHRDFALSGEERKHYLIACVSRALSQRLTLKL